MMNYVETVHLQTSYIIFNRQNETSGVETKIPSSKGGWWMSESEVASVFCIVYPTLLFNALFSYCLQYGGWMCDQDV